jgi:prepilin-type N-terminal cleavage/methylation domain-containing protein
MFTSLKNSKKGFTLIELLVVIAIIGILSSVVLASLSTARAKSRDAKRISDLGQIQLALELFFDSAQSYPSTTPEASTATQEGGVKILLTKNYLPQVPVPPAGGSGKYFYRGITSASVECISTTACTSYALAVTLERDDSTVLTSDADQEITTGWIVHDADEVMAVGVAGGILHGNKPSCAAATAGVDICYDVKP